VRVRREPVAVTGDDLRTTPLAQGRRKPAAIAAIPAIVAIGAIVAITVIARHRKTVIAMMTMMMMTKNDGEAKRVGWEGTQVV
jgi:hypothetical protein